MLKACMLGSHVCKPTNTSASHGESQSQTCWRASILVFRILRRISICRPARLWQGGATCTERTSTFWRIGVKGCHQIVCMVVMDSALRLTSCSLST